MQWSAARPRAVSSRTTPFTPLAALAPTNLAGGFFADPKTADLTDAWLSFSSDQPILAYASVIDGGTTDQTFIPAVDDAGVPPTSPPAAKSFDVTLSSFNIAVSPSISGLRIGDTVTFHIRVLEGDHSFELVGPTGNILIPNFFRRQEDRPSIARSRSARRGLTRTSATTLRADRGT